MGDMTIVTSKQMTYEQFLEWADEDTHAEWVNGEAVEMSPESNEHQELAFFLLTAIGLFVQQRGLGVTRFERFQMKTGPGLPGREPDLMFIATSNLARLKATYLDGPADLAVEIVSPESKLRDRGDKFYEYEQGGVGEYWLIDPLRKQAEFYQRGPDGFFRAAALDSMGRYHCPTIPGVWVQVDWLWQTPPPNVLDVLKQWGLL